MTLAARLPKRNITKAEVEVQSVSLDIERFWRELALGPVPRLALKELIAREKRLGARAVALKKRSSALLAHQWAFVSLQAMAEHAILYLAYAHEVMVLYAHTPVPPRVKHLGPGAIRIYQEQVAAALSAKLSPIHQEAKKLFATTKGHLQRFGDKRLKRVLGTLETAINSYFVAVERGDGRSVQIDKVLKLLGSAGGRRTLSGLPSALRGPPRGGEHLTLPVRTKRGLQPLKETLGKRRTLLFLGDCRASRAALGRLGQLSVDYHHIGLTVAAVALGRCESRVAARGYWLAGSALSWAVEAEPYALVLLDGSGTLLGKLRLASPAEAAQAAKGWLSKRWPAFDRALRRGALPPPKALARKLKRLQAGFQRHLAAKRYGKALALARKALKLAPERSEVQRQVALAAGYAKEVAEILDRSRWWRRRFGDLAAEGLLDDIRSKTGLPRLHKPLPDH